MKIQGIVNEMSQSDVLRHRMNDRELTHEQTVRADIPNVRVGEPCLEGSWITSNRKAPVFFCNVGNLTIRENLKPGDGDQLPAKVAVKGLAVGRAGFFNLENVLITSNGEITVEVDELTRIVPVET